jgi:hypothetical protein
VIVLRQDPGKIDDAGEELFDAGKLAEFRENALGVIHYHDGNGVSLVNLANGERDNDASVLEENVKFARSLTWK